MSRIRVKEIATFPVKSCGGIWQKEADVTKRGLFNDRTFMVVDEQGRMMTQREHPRMALISVGQSGSFVGTLDFPGVLKGNTFLWHEVGGFDERVVVVGKNTFRAFDQGDDVANWLSARLETPCRLVRMVDAEVRKTKSGEGQVAFADDYPILGTSVESLEDLNSRMTSPVPNNRFRMNIEFEGGDPFEEDILRRIRIGGVVELVGETLCGRCGIPQIHQDTSEVGKEPAATLFKYRRPQHINTAPWKLPYPKKVYFGRNFNVARTGKIAVGMEVEVLEID